MIPILLKIKGLYSYKTEQIIDFQNLISSNLFGIFGPVGSGKSAILEAITLALYGETDRLNRIGRNYNIMNLSSDELFIDFIFRAGTEDELYQIVLKSRRKKDFKDVSPLEKSIYKKNHQNEWMPITIENFGENIIGLNYLNFKRTIIIPQGQFQNFIELSSKERTDMMKELFELHRFDLSGKTKLLSDKNNVNLTEIQGKLSMLGEATDDKIKEIEHLAKLNEAQKKQTILTLEAEKQKEISFSKIKEIYESLAKNQRILENLSPKKDSFDKRKVDLTIYEKCFYEIKPIIENKLKSEIEIQSFQTKLAVSTNALNTNLLDLEKINEALNLVKPFYDNKEIYENNTKELNAIFQIKLIESESLKINERLKNGQKCVTDSELELNGFLKLKNEKIVELESLKSTILKDKVFELIDNEILVLNTKAAILQYAENLKDNQPCPLCGSLNHPEILHESEDFKGKVNLLKSKKESINLQIKEIENVIINFEKNIEIERQKLEKYNAGVLSLSTQKAQNDGAKNPFLSDLKDLRIEDFALKSIEETNLDFESAKEKYKKIVEKFDAETAKKNQLLPSIEKFKSEISIYSESINKEETQFQSLDLNLKQKLLLHHFTDEFFVKTIIQKNLNIENERNEIQEFEKSLNSSMKLVEELKLQTNNLTYDIETHQALIQSIYTLQSELDEINKKIGGFEKQITTLKADLVAKITLLEKESFLKLRKENLSNLEKLFRGSAFVDYVSKIYLEELCRAANERFFKMTKQQLSIEVDENNDFVVIDYLNEGKTRLLRTLSGGQKFQAALSLALALADNIHAKNGSKSNFFFIDEGFGSLDKDALAIVLDTLKSLKNENRIVGVISHLEDLQQDIQTYIKITNGEEGSTVFLAS